MISETMVAGEPFQVEFQVFVNDVPEDITGYSVKIDLNENGKAGNTVATWANDAAEITRVNSEGRVTLKIDGAQTNAFDFNRAYMDLLMQKTGGGIRSAALKITLDRGVTR